MSIDKEVCLPSNFSSINWTIQIVTSNLTFQHNLGHRKLPTLEIFVTILAGASTQHINSLEDPLDGQVTFVDL